MNVASLSEPTESECSLKVGLLKKQQIHGNYFILKAYDLSKSDQKVPRWQSNQFPIYLPNCMNPKIGFGQEGEFSRYEHF